MVLCRNDFFQKVIERFRAEPDIDDLEIGVHDFFTNRIVYGLHVYSNRINIDHSDENVFIDRIIIRKKHVAYINELAPAALHCPNPSTFQCFHFGLHKSIKAMSGVEDRKHLDKSFVHFENIRALRNNYRKKKSRELALALLSAEIGIYSNFPADTLDFNNASSIESFNNLRNYSLLKMKIRILLLSIITGSYLSINLQISYLRILKKLPFGNINR